MPIAEWPWAIEQLHATVEAACAFIALLMAYLLLRPSVSGTWNRAGVALGFIALGSADMFRAILPPSQALAFLDSVATVAGGAGFALVWVEPDKLSPPWKRRATLAAFVLIALLGTWMLAFERSLPVMIEGGALTPLAIAMAVLGGFLFLAAGWRLLALYRRTHDVELLAYAAIAILFGFADITFAWFGLWNESWWPLHVLRLGAYLIVLWLVARTHHKIAAAQTESDGRLRDILRCTSDWVWEVDAHWRYTYCSSGITRILGYDPDGILGKTPFDLMEPEEAARIRQLFLAIAEKQSPIENLENWRLSKDRRRVCLLKNALPILDEKGALLGYRGADQDITERKRAEAALRESERKYRVVAENTHDWEFWTAPDRHFVYSSPSCLHITGHDAAEFVGNPDLMMQIVHPEDRQAWEAHQLAMHKSTAHGEIEFRIVRPDGSQRWIGHVCQAVLGEHGKIDGRRGSNRDITDRKEIEDAIRRSEARYRATIDITGTGYLVLDTECLVVDANEAYVRMTQRETLNAIRGRSVLEWTAPEAAAACPAAVERMKRDGHLSDFETIYVGVDGSRVYLSINAIIEESPNGSRLVALCRDVTERKRLEIVREAQNRLSAVVNTIPDLIWLKDPEGVYLACNHEFERFVGASESELVGKTDEAFFPKSLANLFREKDKAALAAGAMCINEEEVVYRSDGHHAILETRKVPVMADSGRVLGVLGIGRDVTERKHLEVEQRRLMAELKRSNAELEQFAYVASHDLRSPLRAIESLSEWLEQDLADGLPPESAEHLRLLRGRTRRMEALLDAMLEYSRAGRAADDIMEVDCAAMVYGIADSLGLAGRFTLSVGDLPRLTTVRTPFERVLRNLIGNAVKHHDKDSGCIAISAMQGNDTVEFTVADDGPGIPEQFRDKVFGMFQTLKPRDEVEGSGMGLALVKKIVERYGGSVAIHAAEPRGTEVRFTWPLKIAEEGAVHGIQADQGAAR